MVPENGRISVKTGLEAGAGIRLGVLLCLGLVVGLPGPIVAAPRPDPAQEMTRALARVDSVLALGRWEEGARMAAHAAERFAEDPRLLDPLENRQALALMRLERHAEALPLLEKAILRRPNHGPAHRNLGACLQAMGRSGRALSEYQEFVDLEPRNYLAQWEYGQALLALRLYAQAETALRTASALCGECPEVDPALMAALLGEGRPDQALVPLRRLVAGPRREEFHRHYLQALLTSGADEEMIEYLGSSAQPLGPQDVRLLVEAEGRLGRAVWSRVLARQATEAEDCDLKLGPDWDRDPLLWACVSLNLQQAGDEPVALAAIERAIALDPKSALLRNNRVVLLQKLGRLQEARAEWRRAVALDPSLEKP